MKIFRKYYKLEITKPRKANNAKISSGISHIFVTQPYNSMLSQSRKAFLQQTKFTKRIGSKSGLQLLEYCRKTLIWIFSQSPLEKGSSDLSFKCTCTSTLLYMRHLLYFFPSSLEKGGLGPLWACMPWLHRLEHLWVGLEHGKSQEFPRN